MGQAPLSRSIATVIAEDEFNNLPVDAIISDICMVEVSALNDCF